MNWRTGSCVVWSTIVMLGLGLGDARAETRLLRYPDIHNDTLVFCYGGDIYTAATDGSHVQQITDFPGEEKLPRFSPDGRQIAFSAEFEGNEDVYTMPVGGGEAKRLSFHAAQDLVVDWHPDGTRVLFRSNRSSSSYRFRRLFEVSVKGGLPEVLEIPQAEHASYNASGDKVAFCPTSTETIAWKGYRGGAVPKVWIYDPAAGRSELVIDDESVNHHPMWMGDEIYFVSDRGDGREQNLWVFDTAGKAFRQITFFEDWSVNWPSRGDHRIVYENEGSLVIFDARTGQNTPVKIQVLLPEDTLVEEKDVSDQIGVPTLSPDGTTLVLSARGDLFFIDPRTKTTRNLSRTPGARERSPVWSPTGQHFAYISDISGEEQIYIRGIDAHVQPVQISGCEATRIGELKWSPDGTKLGYADKRASYSFIDIESKITHPVFFDEYSGSESFVTASWAPDSQWLAYSLGNSNQNRSIFLYSLQSGEQTRVTDELASSFEPQFDPNGRYLFWISDCQIHVRTSYGDGEHHMENPSRILVATLHEDDPSPFAGGQRPQPALVSHDPLSLRIDLDGLGNRIAALPIDASSYSRLAALGGKLIYRSAPEHGASSFKLFDMDSQSESDFLTGVWRCVPAARADKAAYLGPDGVGIVDIAADQQSVESGVDLSGLKMRIDRRLEWRQIFNEAWRIQRDFFFDEKLHGVDWQAMKNKYEALVPFVASRADLNYLIEQLYSELGQSHVEVYGGDSPVIPSVQSGVLGADLEWDSAGRQYRIKKIYRGQNWDSERSSPLLQPGLGIEAGDFLLAIDGTPLVEDLSPYSLLEGKAGESVSLTTHSRPSVSGSSTSQVRLAAFSEDDGSFLRYNEWVLENMEKVKQASGGRIGYIHIPDTYLAGIEAFFRYFHSQRDKDALILDIRFNSGGYTPFWMIERLNRQPAFYTALPYGRTALPEPDPASFGPKVCLTNEWAESGGDIFAAYFRLSGGGPLIGKKTAGNLAASRGFRLIDGGVVVYPAMGIRNAQGETIIENIGMSPDIEVTNHPDRMMRGHDEQLERAINELMSQLGSGARRNS